MALIDSSGRFLFGDFSFSSFKCPNCTDVCFFNDPSCFLPAPPPDSDSDNNATQTKIQIHHPSHLLPGFLIAAGALLLVSFLVFLTFYVVLKRRRCLRRQNLALPTPPHQDGDGDDAAGDGQGHSTHHVWLIRTVGLDESIIGSIATTVYKSRHGGGDCTVCLGEFKDGEMVKLLPRCTHPFHVSCIDTWLRSHVNCPLCRAPVFLATDHAQVDGGASRTGSDPHVGTLDAESDASASSSSSSSTSVSLELPKETEDNGFQPVRRSVSMDASSLASLLRNAEQAEKGHGENARMELELCVVSGNKGKQGTALLKGRGPLAMKRSQSTRSGRFFFPRYGRGRNPILPL